MSTTQMIEFDEKITALLKTKSDLLTSELEEVTDLLSGFQQKTVNLNYSETGVHKNWIKHNASQKYEKIERAPEDKKALSILVKRKLCAQKSLRTIIATVLVFSLSIFISHFANDLLYNQNHISDTPLKTEYLIQNLKGDSVDTWKSWHLPNGQVLTVNIVNADTVSQDKLNAIKGAILDEQSTQIDDSSLGKGPSGTTSTLYLGWQGALKNIAHGTTMFYIPTKFNVIESTMGEGDITITLLNLENADGYTGYTKSDTDGNQILKSSITIFNVDKLTPQQLGAITRHEFGHALGLAHSTAPEDLMHATIQTDYPFISECDIDAIKSLYDGSESSRTVCEK